MKKALILTVGTGTSKSANMVDPLCKAVGACNPNFTVLVATKKSGPSASKIAKRCGLARNEFRIVKLTNENDLEKTFLEIEKAIKSVRTKGYRPEEIDVDFTSGTKPMSAAAVLSAVRHGCGGLRYVSGDRVDGVVRSGRERPLLFPTGSILAMQQLDLADSFVKQLQFGAAREIIGRIRDDLVNEKDRKLAEELSNIAMAYDRWDKFDHHAFLESHKKLGFSLPPTKLYKTKKRTRELLGQLVRASKKNPYSFLAVADLLNNAERRALEGKYDDAVARIYRAVEMLGQERLQRQFGIDSSAVDPNGLSPNERALLKLDRTQKKPAKIGRAAVFQLLEHRKDGIGLSYAKNRRLQALLGNRNSSILAHGSQPIAEADFRGLLEETMGLCRMHDKKIDSFRRGLQFPWIPQHPTLQH